MKYMINTLTIAFLFLATNCTDDFLERPNRDSPGEEFLTGDESNMIALVNAAYSSLQKNGLYGRIFPMTANARSDESRMTKNTPKMEEDGVAAFTYTNTASGRVGEMIWRDSYNGIYRANVAIDWVKKNEKISSTLQKRLLAEAYFLKTLYYLPLVMHYGEFIPAMNNSGTVYNKPFTTADAAWEMMISDLQTSIGYFTEVNFTNNTWSGEDIGRANLGAATGLLGKVYLFYAQMQKNNSKELLGKAKEQFLKIYNQEVGTYNLLSNYPENFKNYGEYNTESLFEIGFGDFGFKVWEIDQDNAGAIEMQFITKSATYVDGVGDMWWNESPSTRIYHEYERDASGKVIDYRFYYTLWTPEGAFFNDYRRIGDSQQLEDRVVTYETSPWPGKDNAPSTTKWGDEYNDYRFYGWRKYGFDYNFWLRDNVGSSNIGSDINYRYMRFADVLLMLAECELYLGNDPKPYINLVRTRANNQYLDKEQMAWGNVNLPYISAPGNLPMVENSDYASNLEAAIQHERMVELAGEAIRYFDIIRWAKAGVLIDLRTPGFPKADISDVIIDKGFNGNTLFPIPQSELDGNSFMKPNSAN